jgi:acyl-CoA synthetase (NDP forming)
MKKHPLVILTFIICAVFGGLSAAGIPVFDGANLANSQMSHIATIAKWVESIAQLKNQINHLKDQISLQTEIRNWTGDPKQAAGALILDVLREGELNREYGIARDTITLATRSLDTLGFTDNATYRNVTTHDINGNAVAHDPLSHRRYSTLDARTQNTRNVTTEVREREKEIQEEIALTLAELRTASTDAEVQKQAAKLTVLNGQLYQVESVRRREVDEVMLQKINNDSRREMEQVAAHEIDLQDEYLAAKRVSEFMRSLHSKHIR